MDGITTITVLKSTREELEKKKIHPRQSFDEIIRQLIGLSNPPGGGDSDELG
jgi:hypothetical protein